MEAFPGLFADASKRGEVVIGASIHRKKIKFRSNLIVLELDQPAMSSPHRWKKKKTVLRAYEISKRKSVDEEKWPCLLKTQDT